MKNIKININIILITLFLSACSSRDENVIKYVDPFIGTGKHGHVFPGASAPFGFVQLSPDNPSGGWDWTSGYNYSDSVLLGFSHTHLSGTGVGDLLDILALPFTGDYLQKSNNKYHRPYYVYTHDKESASPGYYSVEIDEGKIKAELTAAERTGFHKYFFSGNSEPEILLDLGYAQNWDSPINTNINIIDSVTVSGFRISKGWAKYQPVYFFIRFNVPFKAELFDAGIRLNSKEITAEKSSAVFHFNRSVKSIEMKVALSSASIGGAAVNMSAEIPDWDFQKAKNAVEQKWETELGKINIKTDDVSLKKIFYTALYHSMLAPNLFSDENDEYFGADRKIHKAGGYKKYTLFSLWDTFRALHPLITIVEPEIVDDFVKSMLSFYDEYGLLPTWDLESNETDVMIGYHAVPVIIDAYFKSLTSAEPERIFAACKTSAMQNKFGINYFRKFGYVPSDLEKEAVSKTLEYAYDDRCIAEMARKLNKTDDYQYFLARSESYKNLFDSSTGFMRGKYSAGSWVKDFNPIFVKHRQNDYTEANAWQYTFFVPQDVQGLIELFGGRNSFIKKLDSLFSINSKIEGDVSPDISGLIGQYAHGNEPCHHIAYLYSFAGSPAKGQNRIAEIRNLMYKDAPDGLPGNDDCGQMSAWYVFSALGFYPVNPADGKYILGTPLFDEAEIKLSNSKRFTVRAERDSPEEIISEKITLNGKILKRNFITHKEIISGGELIFYMSK